MPLIVTLSQANLTMASDAIAVGVDALLVTVEELDQEESNLTELAKAAGDTPWGISLKNIKGGQIDRLLKMGCDFIVFQAATAPASLVEEERLGKIVMIDLSLSDGMLETLEQLPVDAILIDEREQGKSTPRIYHLMLCQYLSNLTGKPLLFAVSPDTSDTELQALRKYGVDGVVAEMRAEHSKKLTRLRQDINKLPPIKRRREGAKVLLPSLGSLTTPSPSEEDEEEI